MYGIFVNENGCIRYAQLIAAGYKPIETRSRDMLKALIGQRVAIIRTHRGKLPVIVGYADITGKWFCPVDQFRNYFDQHLVPAGSGYDAKGRGKWFYYMANPEVCKPYELPATAVRHGRSWCEF